MSHSRFPNCAKSIQAARPRLSFTATYRSQQMEQGASDGLLYKQLGGRPKKNRRDERKNASRRRQLGLSEESTQRTRTHTQTKLLPTPRRPSAPYSDCTKGVLQGLHRRAAWTGMSQLTAAIRLAFPSSCATRNTAAPHFSSGPQKHTRTNALLLARWGAPCARHWAIATFFPQNCNEGHEGGKKKKNARD